MRRDFKPIPEPFRRAGAGGSLSVILLVLALLATPALADEIHLKEGSSDHLMEVEVRSVTYKKVFYVRPPMEQEQDEDMEDVSEIVFTVKPPDYESAEAYYAKGNYTQAASAFKRATKDPTRNGWVDQYCLFYIARCQLALGASGKASEAYQELLTKFSDTIHLAAAHLALAEIHLAGGRIEEARGVLKTLVDKVKKDNLKKEWGFQANLSLCQIDETQAQAAKDAGKLDKAGQAYKKLSEETRSASKEIHYKARLGFARCALADAAKRAAAREACDGLVKSLENEDTEIKRIQRTQDAEYRIRSEGSGTWLETEGESYYFDTAVLAGAYNGLAVCLFDEKQYKPALRAALRVVVLYPHAAVEMPQALYYAACSFDLLANDANGWKDRSRAMQDRLRAEFGDTEWARMPLKR